MVECGANRLTYVDGHAKAVTPYIASTCDQWNNTYHCVRTYKTQYGNVVQDDMFCEFQCFTSGHVPVPCEPGTPEATGEYYNLQTDPWQLNNTVSSLSESQLSALKARAQAMRACKGQKQCQGSSTTSIA